MRAKREGDRMLCDNTIDETGKPRAVVAAMQYTDAKQCSVGLVSRGDLE